MRKRSTGLLGALILSVVVFQVQALEAPVGVRPCCAFGTDLKAQLAGVPVPFFSLENVLEPDDLGKHVYNDGSQGVTGSLLGIGNEHNGLLYTHKGGFIDMAHVRDTADYTYYLYNKIWPYIGTDYQLDLPAELRRRQIVLKKTDALLDNDTKRKDAIPLAGLLAFRLAQWHEIAQWFGMTSVGGWSEMASAFSPEDLYSNMLGAKLAMQLLEKNPLLSKQDFCVQLQNLINQALKQLNVVDKSETEQRIKALDGNWWDSNERLPEKWVVRKRDYHLQLALMPHGADQPVLEQLSNNDCGELRLLPDEHEKAFAALPQSMKSKPYWQTTDFCYLADFARKSDLKLRKDADINAES